MQSYDVSLMISPPEVAPVTLLLEGSNVGRGDQWYLLLNSMLAIAYLVPMLRELSEREQCPFLVVWHNGRTSVFGQRTVLHSTCS